MCATGAFAPATGPGARAGSGADAGLRAVSWPTRRPARRSSRRSRASIRGSSRRAERARCRVRHPCRALRRARRATLRAWARWERRFGIVSRRPTSRATFDTRFSRRRLPADGYRCSTSRPRAPSASAGRRGRTPPLRAVADVGLDVREERQRPRRPAPARAGPSAIRPRVVGQVDDEQPGRRPAASLSVETSTDLVARGLSAPRTFDPNSRSGTNATTRANALLRAELLELAAHGLGAAPHLARPRRARCGPRGAASSPSIPASSSSFSARWTAGTAARGRTGGRRGSASASRAWSTAARCR